MGRRDAVQFSLELVAEWRRLGARVTFEPGWETRGNGTSANYEGVVVHHTVGGSSAAKPLPSKNVLKDGRTGLPGPLCNSAGPWCEEGDPWIHVMAAHPSNNAGASGGKSMGPLPVTSLFNPLAWGHEIDYLGDRPMTKGQEKSALIVAAGAANVLARSTEYVRAHAETSVTGKWDPGYAPGKTIDMAAFRRSAAVIASRAAPAPITPAPTAPARTLEVPVFVQLPVGQAVNLPVPAVGPGQKAVLVVSTDSVSGARIYSKAVTRVEGKSVPLLEGAGDWTKWLSPGFRDERDVTQYHSIELVANGTDTNKAPLASAVISIVPA